MCKAGIQEAQSDLAGLIEKLSRDEENVSSPLEVMDAGMEWIQIQTVQYCRRPGLALRDYLYQSAAGRRPH